jgi:cytochrome c556
MKTTAMAACALFLAMAVYAHEDEEFEGWMKQTNKSYGSAQKAVAAKQAAETAAAGDKLAELFEHVRSHFEGHKMADGIEFAKTAHDAAKELAADAKAGNWEKASADLKTMGGTCQGCHAAHRVKKPNGEYEMK